MNRVAAISLAAVSLVIGTVFVTREIVLAAPAVDAMTANYESEPSDCSVVRSNDQAVRSTAIGRDASVSLELSLRLDPSGPLASLSDDEYVKVMGDLHRTLLSLLGTKEQARATLLAWSDIDPGELVGGYLLRQERARQIMDEHLSALQSTESTERPRYTVGDDPCPNCVPRPPLHLIGWTAPIADAGRPLVISADSSVGVVTAGVDVVLRVASPMEDCH